MMEFVCLIVALLACTVGAICGMGGGVIIKPILDAVGLYSVAAINFLSGCTVLGMSIWSIFKMTLHNEVHSDLRRTGCLAVSAAIAGAAGKQLYKIIEGQYQHPDTAGAIQAGVLMMATFLTLLYTVKKETIPTYRIKKTSTCLLIGFGLGFMGAFLGIGGGPFNVAIMCALFSMSVKEAAQNSMYVIFCSQGMGLLITVIEKKIPQVALWVLVGMIGSGIIGSELGRQINKKVSEQKIILLYEAAMAGIILLNIWNMIHLI